MADWTDPVNSIPVLFVRGTHYEAARLTGKAFSANINAYCQNEADFFEKMVAYCETETGKKYYDGFYETGQRRCPQYMDEIRGIADGAGLPFQTIFLRNHMREFGNLLSQTDGKPKGECTGSKACTDIVVSTGNVVLIGHTEDDGSSSKDLDYMIVADIIESTNEDGRVYGAEKFLSHCCAGNLPGWCMSFNQYGMAYTTNSLESGICTINRLSEVVHQRHLLAAKNFDDVLRILEDKDNGSNCSFCVKIGFHGNSNVRAFEVCPKHVGDPGNRIHVTEIANTEDGGKDGYYLHTNHYLELDVPGQVLAQSSLYRLETISKMKPPRTMADVCGMLALDKVNRQNEETSPGFKMFTLCTDIFDLVAGELLLYRKRSAPSEPPLLRLPFSILK